MENHLFMVVSNCPPEREAEFNRWYDGIHVPDILQMPGFVSAKRYRLAGNPGDGQGKYLAIYEIQGDQQEVMAGMQKSIPELAARGRLFDGIQIVYSGVYNPLSGSSS